MNILRVGLVLFLVLLTGLSYASFKAKEKRWAEQIAPTLVIGEPVWLAARGEKFLSIYTEASGDKPQGGVLILHGVDVHPDWPEVIFPLRTELPEQGWSTLSLQMPLLPPGAPLTAFGPIFDEAMVRIRAGLDLLHAEGIKRIVLIGHDMGAAMGAAYLASGQDNAKVAGFVGIAMDAPTITSEVNKLDPRLYTPNSLERLKLPVLDLYGGLDKESITGFAPLRSAVAKKAGNPDYEQQRFPDADHYFTGQDKALTKRVIKWLNKHFATP